MGYRIRECRKARRMSQSELARLSGVSRSIISGLETGRTSVTTTSTILKISNALNVTVEELFYSASV